MLDNAIVFAGNQLLTARFASYRRLTVRQRKRWLEILTSFETRNEYDVYDERQEPVLHVAEEAGGLWAFIKRIFLGPIRPFLATVSDVATGQVWFRLRRKFRWFFHRLEVEGPDGAPLGAVEKRWSWVRRIYTIEGPEGQPLMTVFGPMLKPWTFELQVDGHTQGTIQKKWSGFGKELFTDADNFGVELGDMDPALKILSFAATVLIDVVHFERAKQ